MVMKFADPMTAACYYPEKKLLFVAGWDRAVRAIDLEKGKIVKHFVASKEAIQVIKIYNNKLYVSGCDPIIREFDLETGESRMF